MKYYYNKAQPNIEYGMLSSRYLNNPKRKPTADGLKMFACGLKTLKGLTVMKGNFFRAPAKRRSIFAGRGKTT